LADGEQELFVAEQVEVAECLICSNVAQLAVRTVHPPSLPDVWRYSIPPPIELACSGVLK
ncbi:MAG: hypothetical protein ACR2N9_07780, partial [Acidimicrobiia bacterium]